MKATQIRDKSTDELKELSTQKRDELFRLRMELYTGQLENPTTLKSTRREIARIETVLRERELAET